MEENFLEINASKPDMKSSNVIRNTKYTLLTFVPLVIRQQFKSFSSILFFIIMLLQLNEMFAIMNFSSAFFPWFFVVSISLVNEGIDDYRRYLRDKKSNRTKYRVFKKGIFKLVSSSDLKTGDIILILKGDKVPADCILLKSDDKTGEIFLRTDQLDGETDWKRRLVVNEMQNAPLDILDTIRVHVEKPQKNIYGFNGQIWVKKYSVEDLCTSSTFPCILDPIEDQVSFHSEYGLIERTRMVLVHLKQYIHQRLDILRGRQVPGELQIENDWNDTETNISSDKSGVEYFCSSVSLENTAWSNTVIETSNALGIVIYTGDDTRSMMNTYKPRDKQGIIEGKINRFTAILAVISLLSAFLFTLMRSTGMRNGLIYFVRFLILFSHVIPISLKVVINLARIIYIKMIEKSTRLRNVIVRNSSIQEELGVVSYILTDKTGTLTKNEMIMKKIHLGSIGYNAEQTREIYSTIQGVLNYRTYAAPRNGGRTFDRRIFDFMEALVVCHNVTPVTDELGVTSYQASSPDEIAIVKYTESVGMKLIRRDRYEMSIISADITLRYRILEMFPFNSDTKRMGIIVQRISEKGPEGIVFFEKGADSTMKKIVDDTEWVDEETEGFAREGLRTLLVAKRDLTAEEYLEFSRRYEDAKLSLVDRSTKMFEVQKDFETRFHLLGITGVEDKLQDRVRESLESLRNAGIRIWMLTGDKIETAISIAYSSRLMTREDRYMVISNSTCHTFEDVVEQLEILDRCSYNVLIIDGESLSLIPKKYVDVFIGYVKKLTCLVGCRYSPRQKASMVTALKTVSNEIVCSIGDGGNDVSMITVANVGIGIEGKEGNQASLAADFSIRNFSEVCDLLFWHGRRCYKNTFQLASIILHRGTIISIIEGIFCSLIEFIPISIFRENMLKIFTCITFFPLYTLATSQDLGHAAAMKYPELYRELRYTNFFSIKRFLISNFNSVLQGSIMILVLFNFYQELFTISISVFTSLVFNELVMVLLLLEDVHISDLFISLASVLMFVLATFFFSELRSSESISKTVLKTVIIVFISTSLKLATWIYKHFLKPSQHRKIRYIDV